MTHGGLEHPRNLSPHQAVGVQPRAAVSRDCTEAMLLRDRCEVYWPVGRTKVLNVTAEPVDREGKIILSLATYTPNFKHCELSMDEKIQQTFSSSSCVWKVQPGEYELELRSVNLAGLRGEPTLIRIQMENERL